MNLDVDLNYLQYTTEMDELSLEVVMDQYGTDVWNYAYFLTKDTEMADDISQEVFIKCYKSIGSFKGRSTLKTWLLTITRNTTFTYRRSRYFRSRSFVELLRRQDTQTLMDQRAKAASAESEYVSREHVNEIWDVIMQLPDKLREVLVLDLKFEMSVAEMSEMIGIPGGTVKSRLSRARTKVQAMLRGLE
ncbi:RNA polymerase subunit sigma-70 [Paenibacillus ihbetae]|uniref:RNA polymerase subunit sigma-70 n=1 Tax=Paenibacillus ihbetae TaxID=1870820 RepID=A0A1B2DYN8_9BACL|nr:RNA polymerase sigma factor [Paenibacillus ihbetae]ANY72813.1 RNA polymerase subunit sigma-70 [Paenibacillus ihbetae]